MTLVLQCRTCDLRIQKEEFLPIPSIDSSTTLTEYVGKIKFNPSRNRRVVAPPFLRLELGLDTSSGGTVTYFLKTADFRKEWCFKFMDQTLLYADIDGGEAWGRRKHMSMILTDEGLGCANKAVFSAIEGLLSKAQE